MIGSSQFKQYASSGTTIISNKKYNIVEKRYTNSEKIPNCCWGRAKSSEVDLNWVWWYLPPQFIVEVFEEFQVGG